MSDVKVRLRWYKEHPMTGELVLRNPDGPEAADALDRAERVIEELARALECVLPHVGTYNMDLLAKNVGVDALDTYKAWKEGKTPTTRAKQAGYGESSLTGREGHGDG